MALFAISDLHLALSVDKPMEVFGPRWTDYMERLKMNWENTVSEEDYVIVPGDVSWATYINQAHEDFMFINLLPGKKIILKGNHDYWWTTQNKMKNFLTKNDFNTIQFLQNNSVKLGDIHICGTRGWICPGEEGFGVEDRKIYERELQRLELSLDSAKVGNNEEIIVALHYPPFNNKGEPSEFTEIMEGYGVKTCIYGHLHGEFSGKKVEGKIGNTSFKLVSADYLEFKPLKIGNI